MICNLAENYWKNEAVKMEKEEEELLQEALPVEENIEIEEELDIYTEEGIDEYVDDDSITAGEQGFMKGYLGA